MYLIVEKTNNKICAVENYKTSAEKYNVELFDTVVWDIEISGTPPILESEFVETRGYIDRRKTEFRESADMLHQVYTSLFDAGEDASQAGIDWKNNRYEIKDRNLKPWATCTINPETNVITSVAHGLKVTNLVVFSGILPSEIGLETKYYAIFIIDADNYKIGNIEGGEEINFTSAGENVKCRKRYII